METVTEIEVSHGVLMHVLQCIACLRIETRTGLKHSHGSVLALVRERYGVRSRTKAGALDEMMALREYVRMALEEIGPEYGVAGASLVVPAGGWS
jgi:hypothetical protein